MTAHLQSTNHNIDIPSPSIDFSSAPENQKVNSNEALIQKITAFINSLQMGQNGQFKCIIGSSPNHKTLCINFKGTQDKIILNESGESVMHFDLQETCYINTPRFRSLMPTPNQQRLSFLNISRHVFDTHIYRLENPDNIKSFQAVLKFPSENFTLLPESPPIASSMEIRILNILNRKLMILTNKASDKALNRKLISALICGGLLGIGLLSAFINIPDAN